MIYDIRISKEQKHAVDNLIVKTDIVRFIIIAKIKCDFSTYIFSSSYMI